MSKLQPYPKYKPIAYDYVSQLPEGWELLPNIAIFQERKERIPDEMELLSVSISKGVVRQIDMDKKDISSQDKSNYKVVRKGDIAYGMEFRKGAVGYSIFDGKVSPVYTVLKQREGKYKINPIFFHYMFRTIFYKNYIWRNVYGIGEHFLPLRFNDFKRMYSIVPPLAEQNAIVAYLDAKTQQIQDFITKKQKLIQLLEEKKKVFTSLLLSSKAEVEKYDTGIDWIGEIPQNWKVISLKYLLKSKLKYGANEEAREANFSDPRYIRITDFGFNGELREDTYRSLPFKKAKEYLLEEGDILFARSGATVGKAFQFKNYDGQACFAGYLIKATPNENKILSDYLYLYTQSIFFDKWKNQIFNQATIENIGADKYAVLKVILPPIEEQKRIVNQIKESNLQFTQAITQAQLEIEKLKEYQESLITQVVTGQLQVPMA